MEKNWWWCSSPFFPHKLSKGYLGPVGAGGENNQRHPRQKPRSPRPASAGPCKDEFITIEFDNRFGWETVVFPRAQLLASTDDILSDNGIRSQGSPDTLAIWNTTKTANKYITSSPER